MNERQIAIQATKQDTLLRAIERRGDKLIARYIREASKLAHYAASNRQKVRNLAPSDALLDELSKFVFYGMNKRLTARFTKPSVSLSDFSDFERAARGFDLDFVGIRRNVAKIANKNLEGSFRGLEEVINEELADITSQGMTTKAAIKAMTRRLKRFGVAPTNSGYVEALVRTHAQIAYGASHWLEYGNDPDVWGFLYTTVGDDRVRPAHASLNDIIRHREDKFWRTFWPPNGWNCRCQVIALYEKERQTRIPRSAEVDEGFAFNPGVLIFGN